MESLGVDDIAPIKKEFEQLKTLRADVRKVFTDIETKISNLKAVYVELITNQDNAAHVFGIDSFHFQNKVIESDYLHICKTSSDIDNRMYCEYYRLYKMIQDYFNTESILTQQNHNKKFPVYKDLDTSTKYDFKITVELQLTIMQMVGDLTLFLQNKVSKLTEDTKQFNKGLYIDNMIHTITYSNSVMVERINLFLRYIEAFNKHHAKYVTDLMKKSVMMLDVINEEFSIWGVTPVSSPMLVSSPKTQDIPEQVAIVFSEIPVAVTKLPDDDVSNFVAPL